MEIWNLVFMQYELGAVRAKEDFDIARRRCPAKNIDTGMGLERIASLLQGVDNMYEIDEVYPVHRAGRGADRQALRRHRTRGHAPTTSGCGWSPTTSARALMLIGDGVTPGNEGRGYVLRRMLRRAVRSMRLLGVEDPCLPELLPVVADAMAQSYPELETDCERISPDRVRRGGRVPADPRGRAPTILDTAVARGEAVRRHRRSPATEAFRCTTPTASRST